MNLVLHLARQMSRPASSSLKSLELAEDVHISMARATWAGLLRLHRLQAKFPALAEDARARTVQSAWVGRAARVAWRTRRACPRPSLGNATRAQTVRGMEQKVRERRRPVKTVVKGPVKLREAKATTLRRVLLARSCARQLGLWILFSAALFSHGSLAEKTQNRSFRLFGLFL